MPGAAARRLENLASFLADSVAAWAMRDDTRPQPEMRRAANDAVDTIDAMTRELYAVRCQLLGEMRVSDDAAMARSAALLARRQDGAR
jgi:uroporphyrinogen-III decarboxylase